MKSLVDPSTINLLVVKICEPLLKELAFQSLSQFLFLSFCDKALLKPFVFLFERLDGL